MDDTELGGEMNPLGIDADASCGEDGERNVVNVGMLCLELVDLRTNLHGHVCSTFDC